MVLAVAGVLASVAWPSYQSQLQRGRRADAVAALLRLQLAQEKHRAHHGLYASQLSALRGAARRAAAKGCTTSSCAAAVDRYEARATARADSARRQRCRLHGVEPAGARRAGRLRALVALLEPLMRRRGRGLTLLEMMVALAIVAVLMTLALPSFGSMMSRHRLKAAAEQMSMDLAELRMLAVQRGQPLARQPNRRARLVLRAGREPAAATAACLRAASSRRCAPRTTPA